MVIQVHDYIDDGDGLVMCAKCGFVRREEDIGKPRWCPGARLRLKTPEGWHTTPDGPWEGE